MAQLNSPLQPNSNPKKDEEKKGITWALIGFFVLVIGGPVGFLLAAIAVVVILITKLGKNGVDLGKGQWPSFKSEQPAQHRDQPIHWPEHPAKQKPSADPSRQIPRPQMQQEHIHGSLTDHCRAQRLAQLDTLKEAGLYNEEEYKAKKRQIIRETANEK